MSVRALGVVFAIAAGCGDVCGEYQYRGVRAVEWCGDVYGSEGFRVDGPPSVSWGQLEFRHSVPPGEFTFEHGGHVSARFVWADLESGEPIGPERVLGTCAWTDRGDPLTTSDDVERLEPPTELSLQGHGRGFNLDPEGSAVRDVSWHVVCGDGVFRLDARDVVKFDRQCCAEVLDQDLADWIE
jgi:hypothetical protein